jgi:hypothetical protein
MPMINFSCVATLLAAVFALKAAGFGLYSITTVLGSITSFF